MKRHIVLVGLPGAGKSVAGRWAAGLLNAPFVDLDDEISAEAGMSVAEIFRREGEAAFRVREARAAETVLAGPAAVVSPGGGWAAEPGRMTDVNQVAYSIYLLTSPRSAAARLEAQPGGLAGRPLFSGVEPIAKLQALLVAREPAYQQARSTIQTDGKDPQEIAAEIVALARQKAGW